jgi:hypothetical protein
MAIKRYFASKDNTITNAFKPDLSTRATASNMGLSDVSEVFSIYGQASSSSGLTTEEARVLISFPTTDMATDRTNGDIPASGSVSFYLKMYNADHGQTLPQNYYMEVKAITGSVDWEEGFGLDMESFSDSTQDSTGSSWTNANGDVAAATLVDAIDVTGIAQNDKFTMTVPTSAGGDGVTYTFLFDSGTDVESNEEANTFGIANWTDDADCASILRDAINGVQNAKYKYGANNLGLTPVVAAGTIGVTASVGTSTSKITLTMDDNGGGGNVAGVLTAVTGFENDLLLESTFTGGGGPWSTTGGDYINPDTDLSSSFTQYFDDGTENLEIDITTLVEQWLSSSANSETATDMGLKQNYGVGVMVSSSHASESRSFYTKKFFARSSEFFFKRPVLEARWDSRDRDNRGNFIYSSSLATADENLNKIYLYNYFRGQLRNIPGVDTGNIYVSFFSGSADDSAPSGSALQLVVDETHVTHADRNTVVTGSYSSTGIYTASVALTAATTPLTTVYDVWFKGGDAVADASGDSTQYHTGSIKPQTLASYNIAPSDKYVTNITNLKAVYSTSETARFRVFVRAKDWCPTIYTVASKAAENTEIESGSYKVFRVVDELDVVPYGTGSDLHTAMSYDMSGNYFDLDMSMLKEDYMYGIKFTYYNNSIGDWVEQPEVFKFRVEK